MKTTTRLLLIACLSMPLLAACNKQEEKTEAVAEAPLAAPTSNDSALESTASTELAPPRAAESAIEPV